MEVETTVVVPTILTQAQIVRPNVVLCGRPALTVDKVQRRRPVRTSYKLIRTPGD